MGILSLTTFMALNLQEASESLRQVPAAQLVERFLGWVTGRVTDDIQPLEGEDREDVRG
jgi:hypothetical protein